MRGAEASGVLPGPSRRVRALSRFLRGSNRGKRAWSTRSPPSTSAISRSHNVVFPDPSGPPMMTTLPLFGYSEERAQGHVCLWLDLLVPVSISLWHLLAPGNGYRRPPLKTTGVTFPIGMASPPRVRSALSPTNVVLIGAMTILTTACPREGSNE